jgi:hypothetical protein
MVAAQDIATISISDFSNFPTSGTAQLYVSQYGNRPSTDGLKFSKTYDIHPGTHLMVVTSSFIPPGNYVALVSGTLIG